MFNRSYRTALALSASTFILVAAACTKQAPPPPQMPEVPIVVAKVSSEPVVTELPGRLEAYRQAEVRARAAGVIIGRLYREGQTVKKGTPLSQIDPAPLKAAYNITSSQLASAKASYIAAADKLKRYTDLLQDRAVSELEYTAAQAEEAQTKAAVASAEASQQSAKLQLDYTNVTSPIEGRARRAMVTEGALVGLDTPTPLTIVEQIDPIYVNFAQSAAEVQGLRREARSGKVESIPQEDVAVHILLADGTEYSKPGKLLFSDLAVDPTTDTVTMRAEFPNHDGELLPGAFVNVRMVRAVNKTAILVPRDALIRGANAASLMIVNAQNKVESVPVKADTIKGQNWLVTEGLKGGERIVIGNPAMIPVGTEVKVIDKSQPAAADAKAAPADAKAAPTETKPQQAAK